MKSTLITGTDSYKFSHFYQDPAGTTRKMSHVVARDFKGVGATVRESKLAGPMFFGLQAWIKDRLEKPITIEDIEFAEKFAKAHGVPFNREGWEIILREHGGYMPVKIYSVDEGTVVPIGVAQAVIYNTDPRLPWLTAYLETELLRAVWYPSTVATISLAAKRIIRQGLEQTSDDPDGNLPFRLHDFGQRGVSSRESAGLGGMAHLINFLGTDTTEGILAAMAYYNADLQTAGYSIPAMEHATVTPWGREHEGDAFRNMINKSPGPIVACVSDSYDIYNACEHIWGEELRQFVIDSGKIVVVRPDSGDPLNVVISILQILEKKFGSVVNSKGYFVLNNVRVIQGDGMNLNTIKQLTDKIIEYGYSTENVAFGMGGGLLQSLNRDTFGYACKCNAVEHDGQWFDVFKNPVTDSKKKSWAGIVDVTGNGSQLENVHSMPGESSATELKLRWDGRYACNRVTFDQVRRKADFYS